MLGKGIKVSLSDRTNIIAVYSVLQIEWQCYSCHSLKIAERRWPGHWNVYPSCRDLHSVGTFSLYVCAGIGTWTYPTQCVNLSECMCPRWMGAMVSSLVLFNYLSTMGIVVAENINRNVISRGDFSIHVRTCFALLQGTLMACCVRG